MANLSYNLEPQTGKAGKKKTFIIILIVLIVIGIVGGYFYLNQQNSAEETKTAVVEKEKPTITPSPTKTPIDKAIVTIQVLNGTGTPGQAGTVVTTLTDAGYLTDNIETGNAEEYDNPVT